jgi:hypothetical protein
VSFEKRERMRGDGYSEADMRERERIKKERME